MTIKTIHHNPLLLWKNFPPLTLLNWQLNNYCQLTSVQFLIVQLFKPLTVPVLTVFPPPVLNALAFQILYSCQNTALHVFIFKCTFHLFNFVSYCICIQTCIFHFVDYFYTFMGLRPCGDLQNVESKIKDYTHTFFDHHLLKAEINCSSNSNSSPSGQKLSIGFLQMI